MQVFINESSLQGQFEPHTFEGAIRSFIGAYKVISDLQGEKKILTSKRFFNFSAIEGTHLETTLKANKELAYVFSQNLRGASRWEDERIHLSTSKYIFEETNYVDKSVAELAERKNQNNDLKGFLLNFEDSRFAKLLRIKIIKDDTTAIDLDCPYDDDSVIKWLISNGIINPNEKFDLKSRIPPLDFQTVLVDKKVFILTELRNQGRKVYKRIGTSELWVVDNSKRHAGSLAHIEVFNEDTRLHLGTSLFDQVKLDTAYKADNRKLRG